MKHTTETITSKSGMKLFTQSWLPESPTAVVLIVHGLAEHSGRYQYVAEQFGNHGFGVYSFDLVGHGKSEGDRAYVESFDRLAEDVEQMIGRVKLAHPKMPFFLLGHSMGGALVCYLTALRPPKMNGLITSAPAIRPGSDVSPMLIKVAPVLGRLLPKLKTTEIGSHTISRDPAVVKDYETDPLNSRGGMRARTGSEILRAGDVVFANIPKFDMPLLMLHGTGDELVDVDGTMQLNAIVPSRDKTMKLYDGLYHEILNEPERDEVIGDIVGWMRERFEVKAGGKHHDGRAKKNQKKKKTSS